MRQEPTSSRQTVNAPVLPGADRVPDAQSPTTGADGASVTGTAVTVAAVASALSLLRAVTPSAWTDEVATLTIVARPAELFWGLFEHADLVHALYYVLLRGWLGIVGEGVFAARAFSALAIGAAALGVVLLARATGGPALARWAGWTFVAVPAVSWVGAEARSTALVVALAVWSTYALVRALDRGGPWWALYIVLSVSVVGVFAQSALLLLAHGLTVLWSTGWSARLLRWAASAAVVAMITAPFLWIVLGQRHQVSWLAEPTVSWVASRTVLIWFGGSVVVALLVLGSAAVATWRALRDRGPRATATVRTTLPWLLVPPVVLLTVSVVGSPMFHPRYVVHCCAALAVLAGAGLLSLRPQWLRAGGAGALAIASAVAMLSGSGPYARDLADWSAAAGVVAASETVAGDGVLFVPDGDGLPRGPRRALEAYPDAFERLVDLGDDGSLVEADRIATGGYPLSALPDDRLDGHERIVVLLATRAYPEESVAALSELEARGFATTSLWEGPSTEVLLLERGRG